MNACYGRQVQTACANEHSRQTEDAERIGEIEAEIWSDLSRVARYLTELDALTYTHAFDWKAPGHAPYPFPANYQGTAALSALRDGDTAEFGRLVHKAMTHYIAEIAADQYRDECLARNDP